MPGLHWFGAPWWCVVVRVVVRGGVWWCVVVCGAGVWWCVVVYHLAFRLLEGEDRLVGLNDGNPGSDWFVPFKGSDGSTMPLDQSPGWHHLTIVSDVGAKRSTLYVDGNKWGDAAGAAVLGF